MTITRSTANPETLAANALLNEDLVMCAHRMARRFMPLEKEAGELARKTIVRAKLEAMPGMDSRTVRFLLFKLMRDIAIKQGCRNRS